VAAKHSSGNANGRGLPLNTHDENLCCVVYLSTASALFSAPQLDALLHQAQAANHRVGITGALLYHDGNFIQAMEGSRPAVDTLMSRIRKDPRHHGIMVLLDEAAPSRRFAGWSMGLVRPDALPGAEVARANPFANVRGSVERDVVLLLLASFQKNMG